MIDKLDDAAAFISGYAMVLEAYKKINEIIDVLNKKEDLDESYLEMPNVR